jgi:NADH-quinone oxidoreductase subunit H
VPDFVNDVFKADWFPYALALVYAALLMGFMLVNAIFSVWLERKVSGRMQDRLGPTRVGGKFGWLQTLADGMKLLVKEDIIPDSADRLLFRFGPYIALAGSYMAFLALPFGYIVFNKDHGYSIVAQETNIAIFYMLAVMSTEVFGIILAGYGSGSKWSLFGGMREAAQMVSYEVPMALCVLVPVIVAGTMNLTTFARAPNEITADNWFTSRGLLWNWYVFNDPFTFIAFLTYFTCATASCKRAPFDLAEAESELVAGFHTEYSGFRWLSLFMAEYGSMFAVSAIASLLFLGGWHVGFLPWDLTDVLGPYLGGAINVGVIMLKGWFLVFVMMWVRWTLPRLRIDQVMMVCLKYLLPISCVLLLGVSVWRLLVPGVVQDYFRFVMLLAVVGFVAMLVKQWFTFSSALPSDAMGGMWRTEKVTGYQGAKK